MTHGVCLQVDNLINVKGKVDCIQDSKRVSAMMKHLKGVKGFTNRSVKLVTFDGLVDIVVHLQQYLR